jgi:hypothetical protein
MRCDHFQKFSKCDANAKMDSHYQPCPQLVNIIQTEELGCIQHLQITQNQSFFSFFFSFTKNLSPGIGGTPSQKLYLKIGTVE